MQERHLVFILDENAAAIQVLVFKFKACLKTNVFFARHFDYNLCTSIGRFDL